MRKITILTNMILCGALFFGSATLSAQSFALEYISEWQTDFKGHYDWLNYLQMNADLPIVDHLQLSAETLSTAKIGDGTLIDDMLTYSNIEAGNIALTIARLGFAIDAGKSEIFVGINNVNEDYFTSEYTAFFTNSSCGISPTLSCNYDIANFPLASWCLHYGITLGDFKVQTSLYTGQGYKNILGRDNIFKLDLKKDGIFSISSVEYKRNNLYCVVGTALFDGVCIDAKESEEAAQAAADEPVQSRAYAKAPKAPGQRLGRPLLYPGSLMSQIPTRANTAADAAIAMADASPKKKFAFTPWILTEIALPSNFGVLLHGSLSTVSEGCKAYAGVGLLYDIKKVRTGMSFNYASFTSDNECDIELCAQIPVLSDKAYIQPTVHIITGDPKPGKAHTHCIGMLRFSISI